MDVSVRDLRNNTARVMAAVEAGTPVTLTVHGRPVADIVPHQERLERRHSAVVYGELDQLAELAGELAALLAKLRASERRAKAFDCFIAATALAHDLTVIAQDADFHELQAAEPRLSVALV